MNLNDPIPDYYYTRSEDDFDFYYSNQDELDEAYDFFKMGEDEEDVFKEIVEVKDEKQN
jgi:hypothetical protein